MKKNFTQKKIKKLKDKISLFLVKKVFSIRFLFIHSQLYFSIHNLELTQFECYLKSLILL